MDKVDMYKDKGINSMILVVELFNRPHEEGRLNTVLVLLNHALEMLMKAVIVNHGKAIRDENGYTMEMQKCINLLYNGDESDPALAMLSQDQKTTVEEISSHRDEATHGNEIISEQLLYAYTRSGLSIFDEIMSTEFDEGLNDYLPERVLPIAGKPLQRIDLIYKQEVETVRSLLEQGAEAEAKARVRSIENSEKVHSGEGGRASDDELEEKLEAIEAGEAFPDMFPAVSTLRFDVEGEGPTISLKFTKEGFPARYVEEPEEEEHVIGFREVNPFDRYSLGIQDLSEKVNEEIDISWMKVWAVVREIDVHGNSTYHQELRDPSGDKVDRYRPTAIGRVVEAIEEGEVDPQEAWENSDWGE